MLKFMKSIDERLKKMKDRVEKSSKNDDTVRMSQKELHCSQINSGTSTQDKILNNIGSENTYDIGTGDNEEDQLDTSEYESSH